jgi:hypothetical protein
MINKDKIISVFNAAGLAVAEKHTPSGMFLGYKVRDRFGEESAGYKSIRTLEREAKKIAKKQDGGTLVLRERTLHGVEAAVH